MRNILIVLSIIIGAHVAAAAVDTGKIFKETGTFSSTDGKELYEENCKGCHMPEGKGVHTGVGMYPALAGNPNVVMPDYTAYVIMHGLRGMPSFEPDMTDEQIAAVSNHVAESFGNKSTGTIKADAVKGIRPANGVVYIEY